MRIFRKNESIILIIYNIVLKVGTKNTSMPKRYSKIAA